MDNMQRVRHIGAFYPKRDVFVGSQGVMQKRKGNEKRWMTPRKVSSRHNSTDPHMNLQRLAAWIRPAQVQAREVARTEKGK